MNSLSLSIFFPVYNEEEMLVPNTEKLIRHMESLGGPYEILIGSNGSKDRTVAYGQDLQTRYSQVRFFHVPARGPGEAFRQAVRLMRHEALLSLDMDLSTDLEFIQEARSLLETCDIVVGSKKTGREMRSRFRRWGSEFFVFCSRCSLGIPFDDLSLGAKAYRRSVLERYSDAIDSWTFYVQNILYCAYRDGLAITQIPVSCRDYRASHFNLGHETVDRFWKLIGLALRSGRVKRRSSGSSRASTATSDDSRS